MFRVHISLDVGMSDKKWINFTSHNYVHLASSFVVYLNVKTVSQLAILAFNMWCGWLQNNSGYLSNLWGPQISRTNNVSPNYIALNAGLRWKKSLNPCYSTMVAVAVIGARVSVCMCVQWGSTVVPTICDEELVEEFRGFKMNGPWKKRFYQL